MAEKQAGGPFGAALAKLPEQVFGGLTPVLVAAGTGAFGKTLAFLVKHLRGDTGHWPGFFQSDAHLVWGIKGGFIALAVGCGFMWHRLSQRRKAKVRFAGDRLCIFVADFEGDPGGKVQHRVMNALTESLGRAVQVSRANLKLKMDDTVGDVFLVAKKAEEKAQGYLKRHGGHLVIWGSPDTEGMTSVIDLRFFSPVHDGSENKQFSYMPNTLRLEPKFGTEMGTAVAALAASMAGVVFSRDGNYLVDVLMPIGRQLEPVIHAWPSVLTHQDRGKILDAYALVQYVIGEQSGDDSYLEKAVRAYRVALKERPRESFPFDWARTQNKLGGALFRLGERESSMVRLEESVVAYRLALEEWTRERVPLDWARTQNNLGSALFRLGERESSVVRLEESVVAYRLALEEWTRERVSLDWARTQNNLGTALSRLGEWENSIVRLEESVVAYRLALEELTRERVPLDWARTQNNLGGALFRLGERESSVVRLEESVVAYRLALEVRTRERVPLDWAVTQNNLGNVLGRLGVREGNPDRLREAISAYRQALEVVTEENAAYYFSTIQGGLAWAEGVLEEMEATEDLAGE